MTTFLHLGCSLTKLDNTNHQKPEKIQKSKQFPFRKWPGEVSTTKTDWAINFVTRCPRSWHQNLDAVIHHSYRHQPKNKINALRHSHSVLAYIHTLVYIPATTPKRNVHITRQTTESYKQSYTDPAWQIQIHGKDSWVRSAHVWLPSLQVQRLGHATDSESD